MTMNNKREATAAPPRPAPGLAGVSSHVLHHGALDWHSHKASSPRRMTADRRESADRRSAAPTSTEPVTTLPREYFLQQIRREKRRAERTQSPLSIVVYRPSAAGSHEATAVASLLRLVARTIRETDIVGRLDASAVAVLCPDTSAQGALRLMEKIASKASNLTFSVETATYPDKRFIERMDGEWSLSDTHPLLTDEFKSSHPDGYRLKRVLDVFGALVALVLFSPLMLATAIAVAMSSPGPVIFKQRRLGRSGVPFVFYKFRSMRCDADDTIHRKFVQSLIKGEHEKVNQESSANPLYKIKSDPRVTPVGRIIRKTSLDELPQLFNVLRGDMSLVGPRPPLPYEAESYRSWHLRRVLDIKPGITGYWQVEGRSTVSFDEMVRMDLRYIRHCSLALDFRILARTVFVLFGAHGAA